jgi:hypothetical protein
LSKKIKPNSKIPRIKANLIQKKSTPTMPHQKSRPIIPFLRVITHIPKISRKIIGSMYPL